jgi:Arylsulfotransferase (ASST)
MHRGFLRPKRRRLSGVAAVALMFVGVTVGCTASLQATPATLRITTAPALFPRFSPKIVDYVSRCNASDPVDVSVEAPAGVTVSVDSQPPRTGSFTTEVTRDVGQRFAIVVETGQATSTHHIRCLPGDFPAFKALRSGRPQAEWYVSGASVGISGANYPAVFDTNGVPVWWGPKTALFYTTELNGNIAWNVGGRIEEHRLDGSLVRSYSTVGEPMDFHDLVVLPNGNHLAVTITERSGVSLASWGGPASTTILDHIVQEVTPTGAVVWSWRTSDHVSVDETTQFWRTSELADPGGPFSAHYDPFHWNSVDWTGDGVVLSFRHLDAIYRVSAPSGDIAWKLGGTTRSESLSVVGDRVFEAGGGGGFGGQHDARLLSDGTLTVYDNGTGRNRAPRSAAYSLDVSQRTATLVRVVRDLQEPSSFCCGSTRVVPGGNYVVGWGGNPDDTADITETTRFGGRLFELAFTDPAALAYRGIPVLPGVLSRDALRAGMDAQFPN